MNCFTVLLSLLGLSLSIKPLSFTVASAANAMQWCLEWYQQDRGTELDCPDNFHHFVCHSGKQNRHEPNKSCTVSPVHEMMKFPHIKFAKFFLAFKKNGQTTTGSYSGQLVLQTIIKASSCSVSTCGG